MAAREARPDQPEDQARRGDPLRALALGGLTRFLDDGRIEIDNNVVERSIRPIALNRKNALFAGSDGGAEHWAVIASLIETCKLIGVEPHGLSRRRHHPDRQRPSQQPIDELLPWAYPAHRTQGRGLRTTLTLFQAACGFSGKLPAMAPMFEAKASARVGGRSLPHGQRVPKRWLTKLHASNVQFGPCLWALWAMKPPIDGSLNADHQQNVPAGIDWYESDNFHMRSQGLRLFSRLESLAQSRRDPAVDKRLIAANNITQKESARTEA